MTGETHRFDPTALREYDIRGVVGRTLSEADARAVGRGLGSRVREAGGRRVAVGRDGRLSSPALGAAVIEGVVASGCEAISIGLGPTPMMYYAVRSLGLDGGIQVTGSHNPPDYNGFKMMLGQKSFYGPDIQELGRRAAAGEVVSGEGQVTDHPMLDDYVARLAKDYVGDKAMTVAWDAGNGAAGEAMARLVQRLPGRHILLNEAIDGRFPNHHPDPTMPENLVQLQETVAAERCDLGFAFDGDGDRVGVIDAKGRILWGDQIIALLAADILKRHPGATIIADVKASQVLFDEIARLGGSPLMWKTGHSVIKAKMAETGSPLAGEMSGHIFLGDGWYGFDDGLYAAVRILSILARGADSLDALWARLPTVMNTPELRFTCSEERKFPVIQEVKARLNAAGAQFADVDGVRVQTPDGWWLLRASNTQDVLVARCESETEAGLTRLKSALAAELRASGLDAPG